MLDRFDCYELCVQSPRHVAGFLRALVAGCGPSPVLGEDFCGTAAVSRRWVADAERAGEVGRAVAVDLDGETLAKAKGLAAAEGVGRSIGFVEGGATAGGVGGVGGVGEPAHCVFVGNFSIGYIHDRRALVGYLARCRARLAAANRGFGCGGQGAFVCDLYGGAGAFRLGHLARRHPSRGREVVHYLWRHEEADPVTAMVTNSISLRVEVDGEVVSEMPRAFIYRWRLWGLSELREALLEAGFDAVEVYKEVNIAPGESPSPVPSPASESDLANAEGDWIVLVAGRC